MTTPKINLTAETRRLLLAHRKDLVEELRRIDTEWDGQQIPEDDHYQFDRAVKKIEAIELLLES